MEGVFSGLASGGGSGGLSLGVKGANSVLNLSEFKVPARQGPAEAQSGATDHEVLRMAWKLKPREMGKIGRLSRPVSGILHTDVKAEIQAPSF